jgi:ATP-binding cassette subfamily F protein 3
MININNIYVQYGDRRVLDRVSFTIQERDRMGLTGRNGAGKSTLLKIIAGQIMPTEGNISYPSTTTIGFLHQDMFLPQGKTVLEEAMSAFDEVLVAEKRLAEVEAELAERTDYESEAYMDLIHEMTELNDELASIGGDNMRVECEKILMGLGFKVTDFARQTTEFSGGWQMRIELAKMLLKRPKLLLLDEPTNHLDIESIIWLENFLQPYEGAVVVISHDKTFLDNVTKRTIEIELGKVHDYKANYSRYLELRSERQAQLQSSFDSQQKDIARKEALVDKFRAKANKAKMAQSLIKELDRMERIEMETTDNSRMRFQFPPSPRSGEVAIKVENLTKKYGDSVILQDIDLDVIRGERIAFMGKNGEGKSTLIKLIVGDILPSGGVVELGHNVFLGYYAQNQAEALDPKMTVLETMEKNSPFELRPRLRNILGSFLFRGEDVDKKVSVLSGGERARLAMACMLLHPINLLVMDEPTNHLDMLSKAILKQALFEYDGTLIVVSHDRDFLDGMTDKVIEFANRSLITYLGDLQYFLEKRQYGTLRDVSLGKSGLNTFLSANSNTTTTTTPKLDANSNENQEQIKRVKKNIQNAEKKINRLEEDQSKLEMIMGITEKFGTAEYQKAVSQYEANKKELEAAMAEWESAEMELEKYV